MSETVQESLYVREQELSRKVLYIINNCDPDPETSSGLRSRLIDVTTALGSSDGNRKDLSELMTALEMDAAVIERECAKARDIKDKEVETEKGEWIFAVSIFVWLLLLITNWLSMALLLQFNWPNGWFNSDLFIGFALTGIVINMLLIKKNRTSESARHTSFAGLYGFRILQATVYTAVVYQFARFLIGLVPGNEADCSKILSHCVWIASPLFLILSFFIGLFINRIEGSLTVLLGIGKGYRRTMKKREIEPKYDQLRQKHKALAAPVRQKGDDDPAHAEWEDLRNDLDQLLRCLQHNELDQADELSGYLETRLEILEDKLQYSQEGG